METRTEEEPAAQVQVMLPGWSPRQPVKASIRIPAPSAGLPRITRLLALAIKFQDMVDRGEVRDYADLARLGYVTRARLTQIMNLLLLAPDIQVEILGLGASADQRIVAERDVRSVVKLVLWERQRRAWRSA